MVLHAPETSSFKCIVVLHARETSSFKCIVVLHDGVTASFECIVVFLAKTSRNIDGTWWFLVRKPPGIFSHVRILCGNYADGETNRR